ncbi:MAG TPA: universal stress protein [Opitutaceae bacterium]
MKTILVPVDFSDVTPALVKTAQNLASALKCRLVVLHVEVPETTPIFRPFEMEVAAVALTKRDVTADRKALNNTVATLTAAGAEVEARHARGPAVQVILEEAAKDEAEFIVMGSHGHGELYHLLAGGVTSGVLKSALCPVVVVPSVRR